MIDTDRTAQAMIRGTATLMWLDGEARRVCDQQGLTDIDDFLRIRNSLAYRAFREEIERFVRIKMDVYQFATETIILYPDGRIETHHALSPAQAELISLCDDMIANAAKRYGLA